MGHALFPQYGITQLEVSHYRLSTFVNVSVLAVEAIKRELMSLSLTVTQNRLALDLLLAKEGGVCAMIGDKCCTYVPGNDTDHGKIMSMISKMKNVA